MFENNGYIHLYSPRAVADNPLASDFFSKTYFFVNMVNCCKLVRIKRLYNSFPLFKRTCDQILPCRKIGKCQPRAIFVELVSPILHAKLKDHRTLGSGEVEFIFLTIYYRGGHLGYVT